MSPQIVKFATDELVKDLPPPVEVAVPIDIPVSRFSSKSLVIPTRPETKIGIWECSPGRWRRQVVQAEFCHFVQGDCTFIPDGGDAIEIRPGDVVYFPPNTSGTWEIRSQSRKIFMVFGSPGPA